MAATGGSGSDLPGVLPDLPVARRRRLRRGGALGAGSGSGNVRPHDFCGTCRSLVYLYLRRQRDLFTMCAATPDDPARQASRVVTHPRRSHALNRLTPALPIFEHMPPA
jgi:hypothetical protein